MLSRWTPIAYGVSGVAEILAKLKALKDFYGAQPAVRSAALSIARPTRNNDTAGNVTALAKFVREKMVYVPDPINLEYTQGPEVLLPQIAQAGSAAGDCDDHVLLFASLCESLGIPCEIAAVRSPGNDSGIPDHVIAVALVNGAEMDFDLCAKGTAQPYYPEKMFA